MNRLVILLIPVLFYLSCKQQIFIPATFEKKVLVYNQNDTLLYNVLSPSISGKGKKLPLFLFLHGAGERGNDNESQLIHIAPLLKSDSIQKVHPALIVFPQCPQNDLWAPIIRREGQLAANFSEKPTTPMEGVMHLLDTLMAQYPIDLERVYISGLSMGGFGTFDLLARRPDLFAAAISICGGADTTAVSRYSHVPMRIYHGDADPVVSVELSRQAYQALKNAGHTSVDYIEFQGVDHDSWTPAYEEPDILDWLFSQRKTK